MSEPAPREARLAALAAGRALLTLGAVAAALGALAAAAPARRAPEHRAPAHADDVDRVLRRGGARGPGLRVWTPHAAFAAGDPGAEPLVPAFEWVAPTLHGTVTVRQDAAADGSLTLAAADADAELGRALAAMTDEEVLVRDGSEWLAVAGDRARPLLTPPRSALPGPVDVAQLGGARTRGWAAVGPTADEEPVPR